MRAEARRHAGTEARRAGGGCRTPRDPKYFEAGPGGTDGNAEIEVYLNNERRPSAVMAHAGRGWVTSRLVGIDGLVLTDGLGRPRFVTEHGTVELRRCN